MSLKVWEAATAKLTQVLVGHEGAITCVATAALDETLVVSGAQDCNLIVWDMTTGTELFTLAQHNASIMGVILTPDGTRALSYSEDNTIQLWDIKDTGRRLSMLDVHRIFTQVYASMNMSYIAVMLGGNSHIIPLIRHLNNPAHGIVVELPPAGTPVLSGLEEKGTPWLRGFVNRNSKTLKREQSFDSFYFEHMLHRGQSVDDFRKIGAFQATLYQQITSSALSPFGSREQLWSGNASATSGGTGGIYDGTASSTTGASQNTPQPTRNRMISKLMNIGPKQKMLKKQQSMFACFPEFTTKGGGAAASQSSSGAADLGSR